MKKFNVVRNLNIAKNFKGGTSIFYLYIFIIVAFLNIELADYQKYGLNKLTEDYSKDKIFISILEYSFITYIVVCFTSETLKVRTLEIVDKTFLFLENFAKKTKLNKLFR
mgnify:CR=1 FL=1|jgi:hypothetical protein